MLAGEIPDDAQYHRPRRAGDGQVAIEFARLLARSAHHCALERDDRVARRIEKIRTFEVGIELPDTCPQARGLDGDLDRAALGIGRRELQAAINVEEPAGLPGQA